MTSPQESLDEAESLAEQELLTVQEVAVILRVHKETVLRNMRKGTIKGVKFGRTIRIPREALVNFINVNNGDK